VAVQGNRTQRLPAVMAQTVAQTIERRRARKKEPFRSSKAWRPSVWARPSQEPGSGPANASRDEALAFQARG
jgi:hypothetical protein